MELPNLLRQLISDVSAPQERKALLANTGLSFGSQIINWLNKQTVQRLGEVNTVTPEALVLPPEIID